MSTRTNTEPAATPLYRLREKRKLSQRKLAQLVDCSISTVWLAERAGFLSDRMAEKFAKALGVPVEELRP